MVKDKKFLEKISDYCLNKAKQLGATGCELVVSNFISESVSLRNKKVDHCDNSNNLSISLTIYINKKRSNVSSSNIKEQDLFKLINRCVEMTKITPEDIYVSMPDKNKLAKEDLLLDLFDQSTISTEKKIDFLKEMEEEAFANKKITNSNGCSFSEIKSNFILSNSLGFAKGYETSMFSASCAVVAENEGSMETDYEFSTKRFLKDLLQAKEIGRLAAKRAARRLGAKKITSAKMPIIFDKRIAKNLLSSFAAAISGSAFSRKTTFLKDKIEKKIFPNNVNIFDDPLIKKGLGSQPFDSEGVTSEKIQLVENGILKNIFLDTYYAKTLGMITNGRSGGGTNLFFNNGTIKVEKMISEQKKALYITDIMGRGSDIITGDYSVGASGILIENGKFKNPINEITIASNLTKMYKNLILADDLEFIYATNSPSLMINEMTVAGK